MNLVPFLNRHPKIALREMLNLRIKPGNPSLPEGNYTFLENYCADRKCDCRRVSLQVLKEGDFKQPIASISFGWDSEQFYTKLDGADIAADTVVGFLDPLNYQSEHADGVLEAFQHCLQENPELRDWFLAHYTIFKNGLHESALAAADVRERGAAQPAISRRDRRAAERAEKKALRKGSTGA